MSSHAVLSTCVSPTPSTSSVQPASCFALMAATTSSAGRVRQSSRWSRIVCALPSYTPSPSPSKTRFNVCGQLLIRLSSLPPHSAVHVPGPEPSVQSPSSGQHAVSTAADETFSWASEQSRCESSHAPKPSTSPSTAVSFVAGQDAAPRLASRGTTGSVSHVCASPVKADIVAGSNDIRNMRSH
eukprot:COSAG02_NODE_841_length_16613_cov_61.635703_2_plen_184_part_00